MENNQKTVFISYCWTTLEHEKWVIELAEKLLSVGVDVKLDKWDLVHGLLVLLYIVYIVLYHGCSWAE